MELKQIIQILFQHSQYAFEVKIVRFKWAYKQGQPETFERIHVKNFVTLKLFIRKSCDALNDWKHFQCTNESAVHQLHIILRRDSSFHFGFDNLMLFSANES